MVASTVLSGLNTCAGQVFVVCLMILQDLGQTCFRSLRDQASSSRACTHGPRHSQQTRAYGARESNITYRPSNVCRPAVSRAASMGHGRNCKIQTARLSRSFRGAGIRNLVDTMVCRLTGACKNRFAYAAGALHHARSGAAPDRAFDLP